MFGCDECRCGLARLQSYWTQAFAPDDRGASQKSRYRFWTCRVEEVAMQLEKPPKTALGKEFEKSDYSSRQANSLEVLFDRTGSVCSSCFS